MSLWVSMRMADFVMAATCASVTLAAVAATPEGVKAARIRHAARKAVANFNKGIRDSVHSGASKVQGNARLRKERFGLQSKDMTSQFVSASDLPEVRISSWKNKVALVSGILLG